MTLNSKKRVFVAGHNGMVGSAILKQLAQKDGIELVVAERTEVDLANQRQVERFFQGRKIDEVYLAAAKVGGIHANNQYPAEFIYQNLMIQNNVVHSAYQNGIQKLLFLGSSCIYPKLANQPMLESALLSGALEATNEPYAVAKIAGIKLCESYNRQYGVDYRSVMPTNLYGPNDNFHPENSHVIPALIRRVHEAKLSNKPEVTIWGNGQPKREFLYVDDMATASIHVMEVSKGEYQSKTTPMTSHVNVGTGQDCTIAELVGEIMRVIEYRGEVVFDTSKPDGPIRKVLDVSLIKSFNWKANTPLEAGLKKTYEWFLANQSIYRT